jgi:hypothetical protein
MHKDLFWAGHVLSGNPNLLKQFQQALPTSPKGAANPPSPTAPTATVANAAPDPDGLRKGWIYVCALKVTAANFKIDANDPTGSLSASIDWNNAAIQQAAVICIYINQEAPAIAAHDAPQYQLVWTNIVAGTLTTCKTVGDVLALVQKNYS